MRKPTAWLPSGIEGIFRGRKIPGPEGIPGSPTKRNSSANKKLPGWGVFVFLRSDAYFAAFLARVRMALVESFTRTPSIFFV